MALESAKNQRPLDLISVRAEPEVVRGVADRFPGCPLDQRGCCEAAGCAGHGLAVQRGQVLVEPGLFRRRDVLGPVAADPGRCFRAVGAADPAFSTRASRSSGSSSAAAAAVGSPAAAAGWWGGRSRAWKALVRLCHQRNAASGPEARDSLSGVVID